MITNTNQLLSELCPSCWGQRTHCPVLSPYGTSFWSGERDWKGPSLETPWSPTQAPLLASWAFVSYAIEKGGPDSGPGMPCQLLTTVSPALCLLASRPLVPSGPHSQKQGVRLLSGTGERKADIFPPTLAHPLASLLCSVSGYSGIGNCRHILSWLGPAWPLRMSSKHSKVICSVSMAS